MSTIESFTYDDDARIPTGYRVDLSYDDCPENPREWDNVWIILTAERGYYGIDGDYTGPDCIPDDAEMVVPVYAYRHGAVQYSAGSTSTGANPFSCPWDSGAVGVAYLPAGSLDAEWSGDRDKARSYLDGELETYTDWANGSVYCYGVIDPAGEYAAGCGGYYGFEYAKDSAILDAEACGEWAQKDADKVARDAISRGLGLEV